MRAQLKTLIVDDNTTNLRILARTLKCHFSELVDVSSVVHAEDGFQALAAYGSQFFDLILLDIDMPGMSGVEVAREIRRHDRSIMIIACTTSDSLTCRQLYSSVGMDGCVCKPLDLRKLTDCLLAAIESRAHLNISSDTTLFQSRETFLQHTGSPPDTSFINQVQFEKVHAARRASIFGTIQHLRLTRSYSDLEQIDTPTWNFDSDDASGCSCSSQSDIDPFEQIALGDRELRTTREPTTPCACLQSRRAAHVPWPTSSWPPFELFIGSRAETRHPPKATHLDLKGNLVTSTGIVEAIK